MNHAELVDYVKARGGVFERLTGKGRWRFTILGRHPVEIPPQMVNWNARQWGNVHNQVKQEIDQIFRRAGEKPPPDVVVSNGATAPVARIPITVELETADPAPPPLEDSTLYTEPAPARDPRARAGIAKTFQPCPVAGCDQRATGPHVLAHKKRGELPAGYSADKGRRGVGTKSTTGAPPKTKRLGAPAPTPVVGPTSKSVKDLQELLYPHLETIRSFEERIREEQAASLERVAEYHGRIGEELERIAELMRDALKITADQETTLRLVTRERDESVEQLRVIEQTLSSRQRTGVDGRPR